MGYEDIDVASADFEDDAEFEELEDEAADEEIELLATRVRAARFAGA